MKKTLSILFASLILLSGMHLSIAKHFCGGEFAAVKWSLSGAKATCGMESDENTCPNHNGISSNCCRNEVAVYAIDSNYSPSSFQFKAATQLMSHVFIIPSGLLFHATTVSFSAHTSVIPPDNIAVSAVNLADICVFRI